MKLHKSTKRALALDILALLVFAGLSVGIIKNVYQTAAWLPFALGAAFLLPLVITVTRIRWIHGWFGGFLDGLCLLLALGLGFGYFFLFAYVLSKLSYFLISGTPYFVTVALVWLIAFCAVKFPKYGRVKRGFVSFLLTFVTFACCVLGLFQIRPFYYTSDGTVFAVEDEYQIAWSTSVKSIGFVQVGDKTYYDEAGGQNRVQRLHKISVPRQEMDEARSYTITSCPMYIETAYLPFYGADKSKTYSFRPVDMSDGLQIYTVSDNHEVLMGASKAASYFGDKLDLLVMNGDIVNDISSEYQISLIYRLASKITHGERPVIYTRGNHECVGKMTDSLPNFVGSYNGNLFYTVKFGEGDNTASLLVMDSGNDMPDGHALTGPAVNFNVLQQKETDWLTSKAGWNDGTYNLILSHMAFALSDYTRFPAWTAELNALTDGTADLMIAGHSHKLRYDPAQTGTKTSYPVIRAGMRSSDGNDTESIFPGAYTGMAVECVNGKITARYSNDKGAVLGTVEVK